MAQTFTLTGFQSQPDLTPQKLYFDSNQQSYLRKIDDDVLSTSIEIYFTPPKNVIDIGARVYLTDGNDQVIYTVQLNMQGDYQYETNYLTNIIKALNDRQNYIPEYNGTETFTYDTIIATNQSMAVISISDTTTIKGMLICSDKDNQSQYKLMNILGSKLNTVYHFDKTPKAGQGLTNCVQFDNIMWTNMWRKFNVYCPFILSPSSIWKEQGKFLIVQTPYLFSRPGSYVSVNSNYQLQFDTETLLSGIYFSFRNEYDKEIDLGGQEYTVVIRCASTGAKQTKAQMQRDIAQQNQQRMQQIQQQKQQEQEQYKQQQQTRITKLEKSLDTLKEQVNLNYKNLDKQQQNQMYDNIFKQEGLIQQLDINDEYLPPMLQQIEKSVYDAQKTFDNIDETRQYYKRHEDSMIQEMEQQQRQNDIKKLRAEREAIDLIKKPNIQEPQEQRIETLQPTGQAEQTVQNDVTNVNIQ